MRIGIIGAGNIGGTLARLLAELGHEVLCPDDGLFVMSFSDTFQPAPGTGSYILVRAANACGNGSYGFATSGTERTTAVRP